MPPSNIVILYGSESGTAQDLAEFTWKECRNAFLITTTTTGRLITSRCFSFDDYQIEELGAAAAAESIAIFIVATSGQGDVPTNMRLNWRYLLSRKLEPNWLSKLNFAVLALGDSSYQKYNFAGKKLHRRLLQLGATPMMDVGLADEQDRLGIDEAFEKWLPLLILRINELLADKGKPVDGICYHQQGHNERV